MKLFSRTFGEGPPVIILHGLFGMSDNWLSVAKRLSANFSVILPDLRNHGQSPHHRDWDFETMAKDILELMEENNFEGASVIGHSLGGKVAMTLALSYSEKITKLVVVDIAPKNYPPAAAHRKIVETLSGIDLSEMASRKEVETVLSGSGFDFATTQLLLKNIFWKNEKLAWRFNLEAISENIDLSGTWPDTQNRSFKGPALFIRGSKSDYILDKDIPEIKKIFPLSDIETIAGAGHWVHADKPEEFILSVEKFLQG